MRYRDVVLTGLPRSGTTLACVVLNQVRNVVALPEPMDPASFASFHSEVELATTRLQQFFDRTRRMIKSERQAPARLVNGVLTSNLFERPRHDGQPRRHVGQLDVIRIDKELDDNFTLAVKYPLVFLALLPQLVTKFPVVALVRHPLSLLASWNTVDTGIRHGRVAMAEMFDAELSRQLSAIDDVIDRQLNLIVWCFKRLSFIPRSHIIRYEDFIASNGGR